MAILNNWAVVGVFEYALIGNISGDDRFNENASIITSPIVGITDDDLVETLSGSTYQLGDPDPLYEKQFPDAKQRLFGTLHQMISISNKGD